MTLLSRGFEEVFSFFLVQVLGCFDVCWDGFDVEDEVINCHHIVLCCGFVLCDLLLPLLLSF